MLDFNHLFLIPVSNRKLPFSCARLLELICPSPLIFSARPVSAFLLLCYNITPRYEHFCFMETHSSASKPMSADDVPAAVHHATSVAPVKSGQRRSDTPEQRRFPVWPT